MFLLGFLEGSKINIWDDYFLSHKALRTCNILRGQYSISIFCRYSNSSRVQKSLRGGNMAAKLQHDYSEMFSPSIKPPWPKYVLHSLFSL